MKTADINTAKIEGDLQLFDNVNSGTILCKGLYNVPFLVWQKDSIPVKPFPANTEYCLG